MKLSVLLFAGAFLVGCHKNQTTKVANTGAIGTVSKVCDEGRAIYTYKSGDAGGVAIVENAGECRK